MTLITRLSASSVALGVATTLVVGTAGTAMAKPPIDPLDQHVRVVTKTTAGMPRDISLYGRWRHDRPLPTLLVRGSNAMATTTTVVGSSPAPGLSRSHAAGYCVVQHVSATTLEPAATMLDYRTTVVVRRHGHVVARHTSSGTYPATAEPTGTADGPKTTVKDRVRFPGFHFRRHDDVVWSITAKATNQVKKLRVRASIAPSC